MSSSLCISVEPEEISQSGPTPSHASSTKQQTDSVPDVAECRNTEVGPESKTVKLSKCNLTEVPQRSVCSVSLLYAHSQL